MLKFYFSPQWFSGIDSVFEVFSIIVACLIAFSAYRLFRFSKEYKYKYFSMSFLLIAIAYIFKILTNLTLYQQKVYEGTVGNLTLTFLTVHKTEIFLILGYLLFRFLTIVGLIGIYLILDKQAKQAINRKTVILLVYLAFLSAVLSHFYFFIFHITSILLLSFITLICYNNCKAKASKSGKLVTLSFFIILLSHLFFILVLLNLDFYVLAEIFQLFGFIILLITYFMVLKK